MLIGEVVRIKDNILDSTEYKDLDMNKFINEVAVVTECNKHFDEFNYKLLFMNYDIQKLAEKNQCDYWDKKHMEGV